MGLMFERGGGLMAKRDLAQWIRSQVYLNLRGAPFGLKDAALLPAAGACDVCAKRVGSAPDLFSDVKGADTCTDPTCYSQKIDKHIECTTKKLEASGGKFLHISGDPFADWARKNKRTPGLLYHGQYRQIEPNSEACQFALPALVMEGLDRGSVLTVCASQRCQRHFPRALKRTPSQVAAERKAKMARQIKEDSERQGLHAVLQKIGHQFELKDLRIIVESVLDFAGHEIRARLAKFFTIEPVIVEAHGSYKDYSKGFERHIQKLETADLNRLLMAVVLVRSLVFSHPQPGRKSLLETVSDRHGVNLPAIRQRVAAEIQGPHE